MAASAPIKALMDPSKESEYESGEDFVSATMKLPRGKRRQLHRGPAWPSFNGYQSLTRREKNAIDKGISGALFQVFYSHDKIPTTWVDTIRDFLFENITTADSHKRTVRKLANF